MGKKSDPVICQKVLDTLNDRRQIIASDWYGVRKALDLEGVALRKIKVAVGSLCFKQHKLVLRRTRTDDEPTSYGIRGYHLFLPQPISMD